MSDDLDPAIDRAVREMVDIEPPANLRLKVIARIEKEQLSAVSSGLSAFSSRFSAFGWLRFGVLATAAAVVVLAVLLARRSEPLVQSPTLSPTTVARTTDTRLPGPVESTQHRHPAAAPLALTTADSQPTRRAPASIAAGASMAGADDTTTSVEPLKTITPIEVAPIGQASIAPEPIAVRPLDPIAEVHIAPLNPPDRRD